MLESHHAPVEPAFSAFYPFSFDTFQLEAIDHIRSDRSVMVAAPTSSGKTLVAEYALWRCLQLGSRAIYTTPIKALSNQKRRDLEALFPGQVGLLTGDRSENAGAPVVVMTTEVLRNMLVEDPDVLGSVTCVVFDEIHYLSDPDRGTVWEESIISCPPHMQLVCLSATIANADEIAAWISQTHREIALVRRDERPVPLEHFYFTRGKLHLVRDESGHRRDMFLREGRVRAPHPPDVLRALQRSDLLPAIWFAFSRQGAEDAAAACARSAPPRSVEQKLAIERAMAWTLKSLPEEDQRLPQLSDLLRLLRSGVAFHHAGLLPPLKELIEHLFGEGMLSVVCATDTLAVGINMPARTVVIGSLSRPFGGTLTPNDFSQLTGRAGRRGIDALGAVVMLPARDYSFEEAYREVSGPLLPIESTFRLRYSTVISAMEGGSQERLNLLVRSSLRQFQMKARARAAEEQLAELVQGLGITPDDVDEARRYLALQADLSLAEKEQKRAKNARAKNPGSSSTRYERAKEARDRLSEELRQHPFHGESLEMERRDPQRVALLRKMNKLENVIRHAQMESDADAQEMAAAVQAVLAQLGYIRDGQLTRKAFGLKEIVAPCGIVVAELYEQGVFDHLDPSQLAEVLSWFASDSRKRRRNSYRLPEQLFRLRKEALNTFDQILELEEDEGIDLAQGPSRSFYGVAYAWCRGHSVDQITSWVELGEGDVVSFLNKTIDLLDQFERMLRQYGDAEALSTSRKAHHLLLRGLVAMMRSGEPVGTPDAVFSRDKVGA